MVPEAGLRSFDDAGLLAGTGGGLSAEGGVGGGVLG
jgi:hypothetical protein